MDGVLIGGLGGGDTTKRYLLPALLGFRANGLLRDRVDLEI